MIGLMDIDLKVRWKEMIIRIFVWRDQAKPQTPGNIFSGLVFKSRYNSRPQNVKQDEHAYM
jgi:hypothetical protein